VILHEEIVVPKITILDIKVVITYSMAGCVVQEAEMGKIVVQGQPSAKM
jgi:hypothetical protein